MQAKKPAHLTVQRTRVSISQSKSFASKNKEYEVLDVNWTLKRIYTVLQIIRVDGIKCFCNKIPCQLVIYANLEHKQTKDM